MKIQYKINAISNEAESIKIAGTLLKILFKTIKGLKAEGKTFKDTDLAFYPLSLERIARTKKLLMISSKHGQGTLEYLDEKFMEELQKENLSVTKDVF